MAEPLSRERDPIVQDVMDLMAAREAKGRIKYGTTTYDNPLSLKQWLQHALEETLDKAVYLRRAIVEIEQSGDPDAIAEAIAEERESCAKVADGFIGRKEDEWTAAGRAIAKEIRARQQQGEPEGEEVSTDE